MAVGLAAHVACARQGRRGEITFEDVNIMSKMKAAASRASGGIKMFTFVQLVLLLTHILRIRIQIWK